MVGLCSREDVLGGRGSYCFEMLDKTSLIFGENQAVSVLWKVEYKGGLECRWSAGSCGRSVWRWHRR